MIAFASDFDGTLSFRDQPERFRADDLAAIREFRAAGGLFGVCTGRSLVGVRHLTDGYIDFDFYILAGGALILDRDTNPIRKCCLPRGIVEAVCREYRGRFDLVIHANDTVYNFDDPLPMQVKIAGLDDIGSPDLYGMSFNARSIESAHTLARALNDAYGEHLTAYENVSFVDIVPAGVSKGRALSIVKAHFAADRIGGIGDSYNDIPMLERADTSFTFHTAPEAVRNAADHLVSSVSEALRIF